MRLRTGTEARPLSERLDRLGLGDDLARLHLRTKTFTTEQARPSDGETMRALERRFGLTPAEARLASRLAQGLELKVAAVRLGVGYETCRTQLRRVFAKVGVSNQPALRVALRRALETLDAPGAMAR